MLNWQDFKAQIFSQRNVWLTIYRGGIARYIYHSVFGRFFSKMLFNLLVLIFLDYFLVVYDRKIHFQAKNFLLLWPSLRLAISMSPHENWHFPIFLWRRVKTCMKKLSIDNISLTDYKKSSDLMIWPFLGTPCQFLWSIPFFRILRFHVGTLL